MGTQKLTLSSNFSSARISQPSTGGLLVISPRDAGATVAANVIKSYIDADLVIADHGANSGLAFSAPFAQHNVQKWWMGSFADGANAVVGQRTFGANPGPGVSTGTLPASETNIYALTTVSIDGTDVDRINYTAGDPTAAVLDNSGDGEVWFNPITRVFKTSRASSGVGAGIILNYTRLNLTPLFAQALQKPIKTLTFGGNWRHNAQYAAAWRTLTQFASTNDLMVYGAVDDSSDPASATLQAVIAANRSDSIQLVAAKQTYPNDEDLGVAYAALYSRTEPNHTLKDQLAPAGITYATELPYTRDEYGDDVDPNADTFHKIGVNAIAPSDDGGTFIITSERCTTEYADATNVLFGGTRRTANAANDLVRFEVNQVLTDGKASAKFDRKGMATVKAAFQAGLTSAASAGYIDPDDSNLIFPDLEDTDEVDRKKRFLDGVKYDMRVINPMQTVNATVGVYQ